jgi:hypothetical protein
LNQRKLNQGSEIVLGYENGISNRELAQALTLDPSAVSKRPDPVRGRPADSSQMMKLLKAMKAIG